MYDNASSHADATHLVRYLRWANARGLLAEPLDGDDVLEAVDHKFVDEHLTEVGERFTTAYYASGYLREFEPDQTEFDTFRHLDARFAEWQRGDRSAWPTEEAPPRRAPRWALAGVAGVLTVAVGVATDPAVVVLAWLVVGVLWWAVGRRGLGRA